MNSYGDHVGININRGSGLLIDRPRQVLEPEQFSEDGALWRAWIDYSAGQIEVRVSRDLDTRPDTPFLAYSMDIPGLLGSSSSYISVAGCTSRLNTPAAVELLSWNYRSGADLFPPVAEPTTCLLLGIGISTLAGFRRLQKRTR